MLTAASQPAEQGAVAGESLALDVRLPVRLPKQSAPSSSASPWPALPRPDSRPEPARVRGETRRPQQGETDQRVEAILPAIKLVCLRLFLYPPSVRGGRPIDFPTAAAMEPLCCGSAGEAGASRGPTALRERPLPEKPGGGLLKLAC